MYVMESGAVVGFVMECYMLWMLLGKKYLFCMVNDPWSIPDYIRRKNCSGSIEIVGNIDSL